MVRHINGCYKGDQVGHATKPCVLRFFEQFSTNTETELLFPQYLYGADAVLPLQKIRLVSIHLADVADLRILLTFNQQG